MKNLFFCFLLLVLMVPACSANKTTICYISDMENTSSLIGIETLRAILLCKQMHNRENIDIIAYNADDAKSLIYSYNLGKKQGANIYILGVTSFWLSNLLSSGIDENDLIIAPFSASVDLENAGNPIFRNIPDTDSEADQIIKYMQKRFPGKTINILMDKHNITYSGAILKRFEMQSNIQINVYKEDFQNESPKDIVTRVKLPDSEHIFLDCGGDVAYESGKIANELLRKYPRLEIITTPWVSSPSFIEQVRPYANRVIVLSIYEQISNSRKIFMEKYYLLYNHYPETIHSSMGYEAMELIINGINNGYKTANDLKRYLTEDQLSTLLGDFRFTKNGSINRKYRFITLEKGIAEYEKKKH